MPGIDPGNHLDLKTMGLPVLHPPRFADGDQVRDDETQEEPALQEGMSPLPARTGQSAGSELEPVAESEPEPDGGGMPVGPYRWPAVGEQGLTQPYGTRSGGGGRE